MSEPSDKWCIDLKRDYLTGCATATIYRRIPGNARWRFVIAKIMGIEINPPSADGELDLVTEGPGAERLKFACLILHANDTIRAVAEAVKDLEKVTGLSKPDAECGTWIKGSEAERMAAWRSLAQVQGYLERALYEALDVEGI